MVRWGFMQLLLGRMPALPGASSGGSCFHGPQRLTACQQPEKQLVQAMLPAFASLCRTCCCQPCLLAVCWHHKHAVPASLMTVALRGRVGGLSLSLGVR